MVILINFIRYVARLGEHTISTKADCDPFRSCIYTQDILIENSIKHPHYSTKTFKNDIALLELANTADTNSHNVKTICLPTVKEVDIEKGVLAKVMEIKLVV